MTDYALRLLITFEQGTGWSQVISQEQMLFRTTTALAVGQPLQGSFRLTADWQGYVTVVRFMATVLAVGPAGPGRSRLRPVQVRFDQLAFEAELPPKRPRTTDGAIIPFCCPAPL